MTSQWAASNLLAFTDRGPPGRDVNRNEDIILQYPKPKYGNLQNLYGFQRQSVTRQNRMDPLYTW